MIDIPHLATSNLTINTNTSITVSGTAPEFFPDSYIIFYYCQRLCGAAPQIGSTSVMLSENTCYTYTIFEVYFGAACIVNVTAVFNNISSNTVTSSINTTIAGIFCTLTMPGFILLYQLLSHLSQLLKVFPKHLLIHQQKTGQLA